MNRIAAVIGALLWAVVFPAGLRADVSAAAGPPQAITLGVPSNPRAVTVFNGFAYFYATTPDEGQELWRTDGSGLGTTMVKAIAPGTASGIAPGLDTGRPVPYNGFLYFIGVQNGMRALWRTDGTAAGTVKIVDLGAGKTYLHDGGSLLYISVDTDAGGDLLRSDGTAAGTFVVESCLGLCGYGARVGGAWVFYGPDPGGLWRTDGTVAGTSPLETTTGLCLQIVSNGTRAIFVCESSSTQTNVRTTDGTAAGTMQLRSFAKVAGMVRFGSDFYFVANDTQLWRTDGTTAGTVLVRDFAADYPSTRTPLWDPLGSILVLQPGASELFIVAGNSYFESANELGPMDVWTSDGTAAGTQKRANVPVGYVRGASLAIGDRLFFQTGHAEAPERNELWVSDGTVAGTHVVKDIAFGTYVYDGKTYSYDAVLANFSAFNGKLLFSADDHVHGAEPWLSDGTAAGTNAISNLAAEGAIAGRVYDAATNAAVTTAVIVVRTRDSRGALQFVTTVAVDADGNYSVEGLPTGTYFLNTTNREGYVNEEYDDRRCLPCSFVEGVYVTSPSTVANIDFALDAGATIRGHVQQQGTNAPVADLPVSIGTAYGAVVTDAVTDANGDYASASGLPAGSWVVYTAPSSDWSGVVYDGVSCAAGCSASTPATAVSTVAGTDTTGIDFTVAPLGKITGTVTDAVTGEPIANASVAGYPTSRPITGADVVAVTDAGGTYTATLFDGTYSLLAQSSAYVSEFWPDAACTTCSTHAGTPVAPVPGSTTTYSFALTPRGGRVRGSVKAMDTGLPVSGYSVALVDATGKGIASVTPGSDGTFAFAPTLASGTYYLRVLAFNAPGTYLNAIWDGVDGKPCANCPATDGAQLVINGTTVIDGVNFLLDKPGSISGRISDQVTSAAILADGTLYNASGAVVATFSNASEFNLPNLYPGTYSMHLTSTYATEPYALTYYGGTLYRTGMPNVGGTPVVVNANAATTANFPLKPAGKITGRISNAANADLYATVVAYDAATGLELLTRTTSGGGIYTLRVTGDVIVKAWANGYAPKAHTGAECPNSCYDLPPLSVPAGTTQTVNLVLDPAAHVKGSFVDAVGPITNISIGAVLYDARGNFYQSTTGTAFDFTAGGGTYYLATLASGVVNSPEGQSGYAPSTYNGQPCSTFCKEKATAITVSSGGTVTVTVPVTGTALIKGTVVDDITSAAIAGVPLVVWDTVANRAAANVTSAADGTYFALLPVGKYAVYTASTRYVNQVWNNVTCNGPCNPAAGLVIRARLVFPMVDMRLKPRVLDAQMDFGGDSRSELIWRNTATGQFAMWEMNGRTLLNGGVITTVGDANWKLLGFGDFDGDHDDDFFFRNSVTGATSVWLMSGRTIALNRASTTVSDMNWQLHAIGDFNGDGKDELIWRNVVTGGVTMWEMNGTAVLSGVQFYTVSDLHWQIQLAGDFNGDGRDELVWRNSSTGELVMWDMNGRTVLASTRFATVADPTWKIVSAGDYNGDGRTDLLWRQDGTHWVTMWEMNYRTITNGNGLLQTTASWAIERSGDFNGDGRDEIIVRNTTNGQVAMWETNGHTILNTSAFNTVADLNWKVQPRGGVRPALDSQ